MLLFHLGFLGVGCVSLFCLLFSHHPSIISPPLSLTPHSSHSLTPHSSLCLCLLPSLSLTLSLSLFSLSAVSVSLSLYLSLPPLPPCFTDFSVCLSLLSASLIFVLHMPFSMGKWADTLIDAQRQRSTFKEVSPLGLGDS